jgi:hypothetical protein
VLIESFGSLADQMMGVPTVRVTTDPVTLAGGRYLAGKFLFLIVDSLNKSLGILFLIFLFRTLLRKQWLAAGTVIILLTTVYSTNEANPFGWLINFLFFGLMVFTLMQFGLFAVAVAIFVAVFLNQFPLSTDLSVWYASDVAFTVILIVLVAVVGFRTALAGQPLFKAE